MDDIWCTLVCFRTGWASGAGIRSYSRCLDNPGMLGALAYSLHYNRATITRCAIGQRVRRAAIKLAVEGLSGGRDDS